MKQQLPQKKVKQIEKVHVTGGYLWKTTLECGHIRYLMSLFKPRVGESISCKTCKT